MATEAGGTHPTGMHTCLDFLPFAHLNTKHRNQKRTFLVDTMSLVFVERTLIRLMYPQESPTVTTEPEQLLSMMLAIQVAGRLLGLSLKSKLFDTNLSDEPDFSSLKFLT